MPPTSTLRPPSCLTGTDSVLSGTGRQLCNVWMDGGLATIAIYLDPPCQTASAGGAARRWQADQRAEPERKEGRCRLLATFHIAPAGAPRSVSDPPPRHTTPADRQRRAEARTRKNTLSLKGKLLAKTKAAQTSPAAEGREARLFAIMAHLAKRRH